MRTVVISFAAANGNRAAYRLAGRPPPASGFGLILIVDAAQPSTAMRGSSLALTFQQPPLACAGAPTPGSGLDCGQAFDMVSQDAVWLRAGEEDAFARLAYASAV